MIETLVKPLDMYDRTLEVAPDKSISIRAVILDSFAVGKSVVKNISVCDDVLSAIDCMRALGAIIELDGTTAYITGAPFHGAKLDCGNSGTTARLLTGLLCGLNGVFELTGDTSLSDRPMNRVIEPLTCMGADITSNNGRLPVKIVGRALKGTDHALPIASAQVKSAVMLAGLNASGVTRVTKTANTRNHTEVMLKDMRCNIEVDGDAVSVKRSVPYACDITVPGDISAAAYPLCLALIKNGRCTVKNVGVNRTRTGILDVLESIGAKVEKTNMHDGGEPYCDVTVSCDKKLRPFTIDGKNAASVIDEIPVLCALACFIDGASVVDGADELRKKESDRISATVAALSSLDADITETPSGMIIRGGKKLSFGTVDPFGDHRIAMAAAVAACGASGARILNSDCVAVSYPHFFEEVLL